MGPQIKKKCEAKKESFHVITEEEWQQYEEMVGVLEAPYKAMKRMQKIPFTLSDFYATWNELKLDLIDLSKNAVAGKLLDGMKQRERGLIDHCAVLACTFMDPRLRILLTDEEKKIALQHLASIHSRINKSGYKAVASSTTNTNQLSSLPKLMRLISTKRDAEPNEFGASFLLLLSNMPTIIDGNENSIEYWKQFRNQLPTLFNISAVLHSACPTQTVVEGAFSSLSFILNRYRTRLTPRNLENILIIRLNKKLFHSMDFDL